MGVTSLVRNGAGDYTLTLDDKYTSLKWFDVKVIDSTAADLTIQIAAEDVDGAKTIQFLCLEAGVETDPADGAELLIKAELKNTSVI